MPIRIPQRFAIVKPWIRGRLAGNDNLPPLSEVIRFLTGPSAKTRGMRYIESIQADGDWLEVRLRGVPRPIYWLAASGLWTLGMIVSEQFDPADWHYYQIPETRIRPDDVVFDCGAAEGLFSLVASATCRRCYCIEPAPSFQPVLAKTFEGIPNVEIVPALLSDHAGHTRMQDSGITSRETQSGGVAVEVTTVDLLAERFQTPVTYLKADVEGAEMELLQGALQTIETYHPRIAITTYHDPDHAAAIAELLTHVSPRYQVKVKGIYRHGQPVMLHAW
jgi:FkbM family methyltransferase